MNESLRNCPFCDGEVERVLPHSSDLSEYIRHISKGAPIECPVEFTAFMLDSGDAMVAAWNRRPSLSEPSA